MSCGNFVPRLFLLVLAFGATAHAITLRISSQALETTLHKQLFKDPSDRYYIRGQTDSACFVYVEEPRVSFRGDRVVVHVKTHARLGTALHGACLGVGLNIEADVSLLPEAEGETIGFRGARIENLSESRELNRFLEPFLSRKLPQELKVNAADLLRQVLASSAQSTGYDLKLTSLKIHSMEVETVTLIVDIDGALEVH